MSLRRETMSWDAKATAPMVAAYRRGAGSRGFVARLVSLCGDPACERGATWLLKHHMERGGGAPPAKACGELFDHAGVFAHWESRLHVLQMMGWLALPASSAGAIESFLEGCLDESNTFVRAWAYSGYAELARAHPRFREEAEALLADALEHEEKASVRARVRKVLKAGF
ncbi:MAG: hypothetical protein RLN60_02275 [Phycisphaerales bacterium]